MVADPRRCPIGAEPSSQRSRWKEDATLRGGNDPGGTSGTAQLATPAEQRLSARLDFSAACCLFPAWRVCSTTLSVETFLLCLLVTLFNTTAKSRNRGEGKKTPRCDFPTNHLSQVALNKSSCGGSKWSGLLGVFVASLFFHRVVLFWFVH